MRHYRAPRKLTKAVRDEWLAEFAKHGNMAAASRACDVNPRAIRDLIEANRYFAYRVECAREEAVGRLEKEAFRRAVEGVKSYVVSEGRVVRYKGVPLVKVEYSDSLMGLLLRAHGGDAYKTKTDNTHTLQVDSDEAARKLADALSRKFGGKPGDDT
jgi:hypothetical protein